MLRVDVWSREALQRTIGNDDGRRILIPAVGHVGDDEIGRTGGTELSVCILDGCNIADDVDETFQLGFCCFLTRVVDRGICLAFFCAYNRIRFSRQLSIFVGESRTSHHGRDGQGNHRLRANEFLIHSETPNLCSEV